MTAQPHVAIVGGGIMGLSTAWAATRRGLRVTLVEQGPLPHPFASSFDHTRLIRYPYGTMHGYARMVGDAYAANERLWETLGARLYTETGTLVVVRDTDPWATASRDDLAARDIPHEVLDPDALAARFPLLRAEGVSWALFTPTGGVLQARAMLEALVRWLDRQEGVALRRHTRATAVDVEAGRITLAEGPPIDADLVVVTAGPWIARLVPSLAARLVPSRQIALYLDLDEADTAAWAAMPMLMNGGQGTSSGFYAVPPVAGRQLKVGDHGFSRHGEPDVDRVVRPGERDAVLALLHEGVRDPRTYRVADARSCFYTVTEDQNFVVEAATKGLVLSPCSGHGFKFGPLIGETVAAVAAGLLGAGAAASWLGGDGAARPAALLD